MDSTSLADLRASLLDTSQPVDQRLRAVIFARQIPVAVVHLAALDFAQMKTENTPWPPDESAAQELCSELVQLHRGWLQGGVPREALVAKAAEVEGINISLNQRFSTLLQQRTNFDLRFSVVLENAIEQLHEACRTATIVRVACRYWASRDEGAMALGKQVLFLLNTQALPSEREWLCDCIVRRIDALGVARGELVGCLAHRGKSSDETLKRSRELLEEALY